MLRRLDGVAGCDRPSGERFADPGREQAVRISGDANDEAVLAGAVAGAGDGNHLGRQPEDSGSAAVRITEEGHVLDGSDVGWVQNAVARGAAHASDKRLVDEQDLAEVEYPDEG